MRTLAPRYQHILLVQAGAIAVLAVSTIALFGIVAHILNDNKRERQATAQAAVDRCYASATQTPILARVLVALAREGDLGPRARQDLHNLHRVSVANAPTLRDCRQLARSAGVSPKGSQ